MLILLLQNSLVFNGECKWYELNLESVLFFSDALEIVDCVNGNGFNASLDSITKNCNSLLGSFKAASLLYLNRVSNFDAYHMVGARKYLGYRTWVGHIPTSEDIVVSLASLAFS